MNAGTGIPFWAAVATTARQSGWYLLISSAKYGSSSRFASAGSRSYAALILPRNCARMMQPARQSDEIVPYCRFQWYSSSAARSSWKPWAYEQIFELNRARRIISRKAARSPVYDGLGPWSTEDAA